MKENLLRTANAKLEFYSFCCWPREELCKVGNEKQEKKTNLTESDILCYQKQMASFS